MFCRYGRRNTSPTRWIAERITGGLLVGSLPILVLAMIIMIVSGAVAGFRPVVGGSLAGVVPYIDTFRLLILLFIVGWIVRLLGIALFARLLVQAAQEQLAILAFTLILVVTIMAIAYASFRMSFELRAPQEAAQVGILA